MGNKVPYWTNNNGDSFWKEGCNVFWDGYWVLNVNADWFKTHGFIQVTEVGVLREELPEKTDGITIDEDTQETCYVHYVEEPYFGE